MNAPAGGMMGAPPGTGGGMAPLAPGNVQSGMPALPSGPAPIVAQPPGFPQQNFPPPGGQPSLGNDMMTGGGAGSPKFGPGGPPVAQVAPVGGMSPGGMVMPPPGGPAGQVMPGGNNQLTPAMQQQIATFQAQNPTGMPPGAGPGGPAPVAPPPTMTPPPTMAPPVAPGAPPGGGVPAPRPPMPPVAPAPAAPPGAPPGARPPGAMPPPTGGFMRPGGPQPFAGAGAGNMQSSLGRMGGAGMPARLPPYGVGRGQARQPMRTQGPYGGGGRR